MYSVYRLKAQELDDRFLEALKALFKEKEIEIAVSEVQEDENESQYTFYQALEEELQENQTSIN